MNNPELLKGILVCLLGYYIVTYSMFIGEAFTDIIVQEQTELRQKGR